MSSFIFFSYTHNSAVPTKTEQRNSQLNRLSGGGTFQDEFHVGVHDVRVHKVRDSTKLIEKFKWWWHAHNALDEIIAARQWTTSLHRCIKELDVVIYIDASLFDVKPDYFNYVIKVFSYLFFALGNFFIYNKNCHVSIFFSFKKVLEMPTILKRFLESIENLFIK